MNLNILICIDIFMKFYSKKISLDRDDVIAYISAIIGWEGLKTRPKYNSCQADEKADKCRYTKNKKISFEDCEIYKQVLMLSPKLKLDIKREKGIVDLSNVSDNFIYCPLLKIHLSSILEKERFEIEII